MSEKRARQRRREQCADQGAEAQNPQVDRSASVQDDLNLRADNGKTPGQAAGRHHCIGHAPVSGLLPLRSLQRAGDPPQWVSAYTRGTSLSKRLPPLYEVATKVIERRPRPQSTGPAFGDYDSILAMAEDTGTIVIGFDTEFTHQSGLGGVPGVQSRQIDSYQFAVVHPADPSRIRLVSILPVLDRSDVALPGMRISLERALEIVIEVAGLHEHPLAPAEWSEKGVSRSLAGKPSDFFRSSKKEGVVSKALPITLLAHYEQADLTTFADRRLLAESRGQRVGDRAGHKGRRAAWLDGRAPDILRAVISASGGLAAPQPVRMILNGTSRRFCRPIELSIRDGLAHAPAGKGKLADLGQAVGYPKLEVPEGWISRMTEYRRLHREDFLEYGANDAVIVLEYASALYGDHQALPLTLSSAAARSIRETIKRDEGLPSTGAFNLVFGGLTRATATNENVVGIEEQQDYYRKRDLLPVDGASATWQHACANAFRGGYNACNEIGFFGYQTHDYDLISCYPTAESVFYDVAFTHPDGVITETINNVALTLNELPSPLTPFVGFVRFSFPEEVAFPTIPVPLDGSMVFPLSSGAGRGVWASGPEIWLALTLGAEVFVQIGHFGRVRLDEDGNPSRMLRGANRLLIQERGKAKKQFGKKSLEQEVLKNLANGAYGKLAQGVMGQRGWDAWAQTRETVGGSAITSPYHGMMTTGVVRAVLLATLNQLASLGYSTPSNTTDGFITDAPFDVLDGLDLYELGDLWREARESLTDSREMWERKHHQGDLLNVSTRANFSREPDGVLAHGGYKLPPHIVEDSPEDREHMYRLLVTREGAVPCSFKQFPSVQELTRIENRWDFEASIVDKQMIMEFDRKRRPIEGGLRVDHVVLDGVPYDVAHVQTVPWKTPEQALLGRSVDAGLKTWDDHLGEEVWTRSPVRKTEAQWIDYFQRLDTLLDEDGAISEAQRLDRIAKSIVIAQRQGVIHIPWLSSGTGNGPLWWRLQLLTMFGLPKVSERYWKHAKSNQERQIETDLDAIAPYVDHMIATQGAYVLTPEDMDPCPLTEAEIEEIERDYALGSPHIER